MTTCPSPGALRTHLDDADREVEAHATECSDCAADLRRLAEAAGVTGAALRTLDADVLATVTTSEVEAAFARARPPADPSTPTATTADAATVTALRTRRRPRWTPRFAVAAGLAAVVVGVVTTPAGRQAAADILDVFRPERIEVVAVDPEAAHQAFAALADVGHVEVGEDFEPVPVTDVAQAEAVSGLEVDLPDVADLAAAGVGADQAVELVARAPGQVRVTLDRDLEPALPPSVDGTTLVVDLPGGVVAIYHGEGIGPLGVVEPIDPADPPEGLPLGGQVFPALAYVETGVPSAAVEGGATLEEVRDALLSLPGLPAETVAQLEAIGEWRRTLPLPLPLGEVAWRDVTLPGGEALAFGDEAGVVAAVLWQRDGHLRAVGGALPVSTAMTVAEMLDDASDD